MSEEVRVIVGDCREVLKGVPDNAADIVVTSPPYNMNLRVRNGRYCSRQLVRELSTKYEGYDDNLPIEEYLALNREVLTELLRISPTVFYNVQFLTGNKRALFRLIGEFADQLKEIIIWDKVNAEPAIGERILNSRFEVLLVFSRDESITRQFSTGTWGRGELQNVWQIKRGKKVAGSHGAVFPEELVEKVLLNFTKKGDVVLDPFMGTGTSGVVAKRLYRRYVGIELLPHYAEVAQQRMSLVQPMLSTDAA